MSSVSQLVPAQRVERRGLHAILPQMADSAWVRNPAAASAESGSSLRHTLLVRFTHWITALCVAALLVSGVEIVISHPRFYWGETGNVLTPALFQLPIPASRASVQTGYGYVLPDQNGWSRALHFQSAWIVLFTGVLYLASGIRRRHFLKRLLPRPGDLAWRNLSTLLAGHLRLRLHTPQPGTYNTLQQLAYLAVIFGLFPLIIWTGLAMSPAFVSAFPAIVAVLGGHQSARTIHFFASIALCLFIAVHILMVFISGFRTQLRAMITGRAKEDS